MKSIDNSIEERRVGIDNAKLLEELGFDVICKYGYNHVTHEPIEMVNRNSEKIIISAPTQQVALDWILINFDIYISIKVIKWSYEKDIIKYNYNICKLYPNNPSDITAVAYYFATPEEAKEAATNYILSKQIIF